MTVALSDLQENIYIKVKGDDLAAVIDTQISEFPRDLAP